MHCVLKGLGIFMDNVFFDNVVADLGCRVSRTFVRNLPTRAVPGANEFIRPHGTRKLTGVASKP